jgi:hypothetical protein
MVICWQFWTSNRAPQTWRTIETEGPGKTSPCSYRQQEAEFCLTLNQLKQQNILPKHGSQELTPKQGWDNFNEKAGTQITKAPSRQSDEENCGDPVSKNEATLCCSLEEKPSLELMVNFSWSAYSTAQPLPPKPSPSNSHLGIWQDPPPTWVHMTTCKDLLGTGTQQGKFTGTKQQLTEVTENGLQCRSTTIRELQLQPHQRLDNICTKPCTWCINIVCKFWTP